MPAAIELTEIRVDSDKSAASGPDGSPSRDPAPGNAAGRGRERKGSGSSLDADGSPMSRPADRAPRQYSDLVLPPRSRWRRVRAVVRAVVAFNRVVREYRDYGGMAVDADQEELWYQRLEMTRIVGEKPFWVLLPHHPFRRFWQPAMIIPLLYIAVVTPIRIFFQPVVDPWMDTVEWFVTACFWVDIVVNFCSAYRDPSTDNLVVNPWLIARRYIFGWFIVDLIASVPIDAFITGDSASSVNELSKLARLPRSLRLLRLLRLLRALRLVHLQGHLRRVERSADMHPAIARVFMITFWAFVLLHFSGSIWWFIGAESNDSGWPSWVETEGLLDPSVSLGTRYAVSVYFAIVTLTSTGFGEIVPANDLERIYTMAVMLLGLAWAGIVVSSVNTVMMSLDRTNHEIRQKLLLLDSFMRTAKLPRSLKRRVSSHLESVARGEQARANAASTRQVLDMLSAPLRMEVVLFTNRRQLHLIPLLQSERAEVQAAVLERITRQVSSRGDYVTVEGTYATSMSFLTSGRANVLQSGERIASLGAGSYFGLIDCLFSSLRLLSVQSVTDCELYLLRREDLLSILGQYPEFAVRLKRRALARLTRFRERMGRDIVEPQFLEQMQMYGIGLGSAISDQCESGSFEPLSPTPHPLDASRRAQSFHRNIAGRLAAPHRHGDHDHCHHHGHGQQSRIRGESSRNRAA
ncbi:hypothetical protein FNF29_05581 [Cafeteria roenbergensis]|uniref:Cyclic nucleotide-binding domain-containing protein n=1 Tax=Cafeteria roenbergensis TaxID=33653 RepID=A0A5A8CDS7_CAFRO|nr:hypothetical protein FNF29_05581 [Cafeteria roenbergensis]KAA0161905.1 hypothetical protein FNF28_04902 [Cafeteria roenbergensis]|eukprot:KAA0149961.1 hypothetical protein FNF29_05581 [Cafeteria roenbergensis]